ncbi:MAG: hypothetical protein LBD30_07985 [Verrucomicrobiales bacterium]|jgi:hypothetical protein|nr:hypothetical protein [Verrucomicrobiales bacterium]
MNPDNIMEKTFAEASASREHLSVKDVCAVLRHSRADAEVQLRCNLTVGGTLVTFNLDYHQTQALAVEVQQCLSELRRRAHSQKPEGLL